MADYETIDKFDRAIGALDGVPGVDRTKPTTIVATKVIVGRASTFIVQTYRQRHEDDPKAKTRDTIFLQHVDEGGSYRIVIPPEVADLIARQRDALSTKGRKRGAAKAVATRKERGIVSTFRKKAVNQ
jgi:hypothetical protein